MKMNDRKLTFKNALTVDVEDYFQVSAFDGHIDRDSWDSLPCRVECNTYRILDLFAEKKVKATFFILGWVAERFPGIVKRIQSDGHEVASHGYTHRKVTRIHPHEFHDEVVRSKKILEDISGEEVQGYRAPSYSINLQSLWALDILNEVGYRYSSSIYPIRHDHYGIPEAPRFAHHPRSSDLLEIPITTVALSGWNLPCGGGGYFRLYPYIFSRWAIKRVNNHEKRPCVFYFHPWEIDPEQPRQSGLSRRAHFRHYVNLHRTESRIARLLNDFSWGRIDEVYLKSTEVYPKMSLSCEKNDIPSIL